MMIKSISIGFALVPLIIILGNVFPPILGLKIHWITNGILLILLLVMNIKYSLYVIVYFIIVLLININATIKETIDFLVGPLTMLIIIDIFKNPYKFHEIIKFRKLFLFCASIPIIISILQYFKIIPLTLLSATFINYTILFGTEYARVNGFLYHVIELVVIIVFVFFILYQRYKLIIFPILMVVLIYFTYAKSGLLLSLMFLFIILFKKYLNIIYIKLETVLFLFFSFLIVLFVFKINIIRNSIALNIVDKDLFTGRIGIWIIYLNSYLDFNLLHKIFGAGPGAQAALFAKNSGQFNWWVSYWIPHTHNQFLDLLVTTGIFGICVYFILYLITLSNIKKSFKEENILFFAYYILPLLTLGFIHPIMNMMVFWSGFFFLSVSIIENNTCEFKLQV